MRDKSNWNTDVLSLDRQALGAFVLKSAHAFLAIFVTWLVARSITVDEFGRFSIFQAIANICAVFVAFGLDQHLVRQGSVRKNPAGEYTISILLIIANSLIVAVLAGTLLLNISADLSLYAAILTVYTFLLCMTRISRGVLVGKSHVFAALVPESVVAPLAFIGIFSAAVAFGPPPDLRFAIDILVVSTGIAAAIAVFLVARIAVRFRDAMRVDNLAGLARSTWLAGLPLMLLAFGNVALSQSDVIMLGLVGDAEAAGIGRVLIRISDFGPFALMAAAVPVSRMIAPMNRLSTEDRRILLRKIGGLTVIASVFAATFSIIVIAFSAEILGLFGEAYRAYTLELAIIACSRIVFCLFGFPTIYLAMNGLGHRVARVQVVAVAINVGLNLMLIPPYGVRGAAIATAVTAILWKGLVYWDVRKNFGIDISFRARLAQ